MIVNLQVIAANQHQLALDVVDRLGDARAQLKEHVLQRDSLPLWQLVVRRQQGETPDFYANTSARIIGIKSFVRENSGVFVLLAALRASVPFRRLPVVGQDPRNSAGG